MFQRSWFERIGAATALLVKATRIHYAFAPMSSSKSLLISNFNLNTKKN